MISASFSFPCRSARPLRWRRVIGSHGMSTLCTAHVRRCRFAPSPATAFAITTMYSPRLNAAAIFRRSAALGAASAFSSAIRARGIPACTSVSRSQTCPASTSRNTMCPHCDCATIRSVTARNFGEL